MDFDLWQAEQEWIRKKESEYAENWMAGLLPFQCGVPPDNRNYPLTHFIMANIITKDKKIRDQVERHMKNSIEYENPNLKKKLNMNFPPVKNDDIQKALNVQDITRIFQSRKHLSLGSVVVDHNFVGYVTYRRRPIDWCQEEIMMKFNGTQEFAQEFDKIPS